MRVFLFALAAASAWAGPVVGWSSHAEDPATLTRLLEVGATCYGVNHFQVIKAVAKHGDQIPSPERAAELEEVAAAARALGVRCYIWTHEVNGAPGRFWVDGRLALSPELWEWEREKYRRIFALVPSLHGVVLTLRESNLNLQDDGRVETELPRHERVARLIGAVWEACQEAGKELYVRTFAVTPEEAEGLILGITAAPPGVKVMTKCEARDWFGYLPPHPAIGRFPEREQIIEFDLCGEYMGQGRVPYCTPEYILQRWRYAAQRGAAGAVGRIDRHTNPALGTPNEINILALSRYLTDPDATPREVWKEFLTSRYGPGAYPFLARALGRTQRIVEGIYLIERFKFLNNHSAVPSLDYAESHIGSASLAIWIPREKAREEEFRRPSRHTLARVLREKRRALRLARASLADLERARPHLEESDYAALREWMEREEMLARIWIPLTGAFFRQKLLLAGDAGVAEALRRDLEELAALAGEVERRFGPGFYIRAVGQAGSDLAGSIRDFVRDVEGRIAECRRTSPPGTGR